LSFPEFNLEVSDEEGKPFGEFFNELPTRDTTLPFGRDPRLLSDVLAIISPLPLVCPTVPRQPLGGSPAAASPISASVPGNSDPGGSNPGALTLDIFRQWGAKAGFRKLLSKQL